jgi:hypothetical protein
MSRLIATLPLGNRHGMTRAASMTIKGYTYKGYGNLEEHEPDHVVYPLDALTLHISDANHYAAIAGVVGDQERAILGAIDAEDMDALCELWLRSRGKSIRDNGIWCSRCGSETVPSDGKMACTTCNRVYAWNADKGAWRAE